MSWASKIKAHGQQQARAKRPPRSRLPVQECFITVRRPTDTDPGEVASVFFVVEDDHVRLTDAKGKEAGKPVPLEGRDPRSIAVALAQAKRRTDDSINFNRRLEYMPHGGA
jgi:hypothetical protein